MCIWTKTKQTKKTKTTTPKFQPTGKCQQRKYQLFLGYVKNPSKYSSQKIQFSVIYRVISKPRDKSRTSAQFTVNSKYLFGVIYSLNSWILGGTCSLSLFLGECGIFSYLHRQNKTKTKQPSSNLFIQIPRVISSILEMSTSFENELLTRVPNVLTPQLYCSGIWFSSLSKTNVFLWKSVIKI